MMKNPEYEKQVLMDLLRELKSSDMSILVAALQTPDSQIATVRNSANDKLWSRLVEMGFAIEVVLEVTFPPELTHFQPKSFALTEQGRVALPELLRFIS